MTIEIERDMCMHEFSWYDPNLIVSNRATQTLPGIQIGCMRYGAWGMCMGGGKVGDSGATKKQYGEGKRGRRYDNRDSERYVYVRI